MSEQKLYLREDVYFEPLMNSWYAWSMLIPPQTAARYISKTHRRIMNSFVDNYDLHISASGEASMTGGEFLNYSKEKVDDVQRLIERIDGEHGDLIALSEAIKAMDDVVAKHDSGKSIEYLYDKVPDALSGLVEINLDLQHRASWRFIEPFMYRSNYYKESMQALSFGMLSKVDERPFVLSTPRLPDENHLQVEMPYNDAFVDATFRAREQPLAASEVDALFKELDLKGGLDYRELFSEEPPQIKHEPVKSGVRLEYLGHAGFLIESADTAILIDPVIASRGEAFSGEVCSFSELPAKIDYICLTHNHQDHVSIETLLQLRYKTDTVLVPKNNGGSLADPSIRLLLKALKFNVEEVDELDEIALPGGKIVSIPFLGEHGDLNIRSKTAWLIELEGKRCFFGADSANPDINLYRHMKDLLTDLDVYAIGMECVGAPFTWLYGALHTKMVPKAIKDSRRLNGSDCEQAYSVVEMLRPKEVYLYALGMEPWFKYFMGIDYDDESAQIIESNKMISECKEIGIPVDRMYGRHTKWLDA